MPCKNCVRVHIHPSTHVLDNVNRDLSDLSKLFADSVGGTAADVLSKCSGCDRNLAAGSGTIHTR